MGIMLTMKLIVLRAWGNRQNSRIGSAIRNWRISKALFFSLLCSILITACKAGPSSFLTAADFHFDPFLGCEKLPHPCPTISELRASKYDQWDAVFKKYQDNITAQYRTDSSYFL